jgi:hypothetical protein
MRLPGTTNGRSISRRVVKKVGLGPKITSTSDNDESVNEVGFRVLESCHSTWLFDEINHRFCRVVKATVLDDVVTTEWRDYDHLVLQEDSSAFVVFLDSRGTRLLRAWLHETACKQCGREDTGEMSLDDLRKAISF